MILMKHREFTLVLELEQNFDTGLGFQAGNNIRNWPGFFLESAPETGDIFKGLIADIFNWEETSLLTVETVYFTLMRGFFYI